jgi:hypothetical protein
LVSEDGDNYNWGLFLYLLVITNYTLGWLVVLARDKCILELFFVLSGDNYI